LENPFCPTISRAIITNYHLLKEAYSAEVKNFNGKKYPPCYFHIELSSWISRFFILVFPPLEKTLIAGSLSKNVEQQTK